MKETFTSLECRLMDALRIIETVKAKMTVLMEKLKLDGLRDQD